MCQIQCSITEEQDRQLVFEILTEFKLLERLDCSDEFWVEFTVCEPKLKKQVVLHEFETTDNGNLITIPVNPKEYFEKYKDKSINKKHKGMRIDIPGMSFDADAG